MLLCPPESERLPPVVRAINCVVVVTLSVAGWWLCSHHLPQGGSILEYLWRQYYMVFVVGVPLLIMIGYSVPLKLLLDRHGYRRRIAEKETKRISQD